MVKLFQKPYLPFLGLIPIILLLGFFSGESALSLNIHDTYFVVAHFHLMVLVAILLAIVSFLYLIMIKLNVKLIKWMTLVHLLLTIGGFLTIIIVSYFPFNLSGSLDNISLYNSTMTIVVLLIIFGQLFFIINGLIGIYRRIVTNKIN